MLIDVSGSLGTTPDKDTTIHTFMQNLASMYDTVNQVKLQITSFSQFGVVDLPMGFYNEVEIAAGVESIGMTPFSIETSFYFICLKIGKAVTQI